jgi:endonuclease-3
MSRETAQAQAARVPQIMAGLRRVYPAAHCELNFSTPLELLIATILSAQCTDQRVNLVTAELFGRYRGAADYANAPLGDLEAALQSTGFFRNKARNIQGCCRQLVARHGGEVPRTMDQLVQLDGVGRKTANVVLGNAFGLNEGIVVDTHVSRLAQRLGLTAETDPAKIEAGLLELVPRPDWTLFSHWLIWHGRRRCGARKPECVACEICGLCPQIGVTAGPPRPRLRRPDARADAAVPPAAPTLESSQFP